MSLRESQTVEQGSFDLLLAAEAMEMQKTLPMRIAVILCHPNKDSFNHALAANCVAALRQSGHEVLFHDLHGESFDPVFGADEHKRDAVLPALVQQHVDEICEAEGLLLVHPNFWCRPPAMLCGWVDRVLRPGRAYQFVPDGKGGARPEGLLKLRFAALITTGNTPPEVEARLYGDPIDQHWRQIVFGLCGVKQVKRYALAPVITSSPEQRAAWLEETAQGVLALAQATGAA